MDGILGQLLQQTGAGGAGVNIESLVRARVITPIWQYKRDTPIPSGVETTVVKFRVREGMVGYITGRSCEVLRWRILFTRRNHFADRFDGNTIEFPDLHFKAGNLRR